MAVTTWGVPPRCGRWRETQVLVDSRPEAQVSPGQAGLAWGAQSPPAALLAAASRAV